MKSRDKNVYKYARRKIFNSTGKELLQLISAEPFITTCRKLPDRMIDGLILAISRRFNDL